MIESTITQSASKLFDALERLSQSSGSGLTSGGPSGQPSDELIKQFQEAMESFSGETGLGQETQTTQSGNGANGLGQGAEGSAEAAGSVPSVDGLAKSAEIVPGPAERLPPVEETPDAIQVEYVVDDGQGGLNRLQNLADTARPDGITGETTDSAKVSTEKTSETGTMSLADAGDSGPIRTRANHERTLNVPGTENTGAPKRVYESIPSNQEDLLREVGKILENITKPGSTILPTELFRLQYLTGMLKVGAQTGLKASQQTTQGMESVLKENG